RLWSDPLLLARPIPRSRESPSIHPDVVPLPRHTRPTLRFHDLDCASSPRAINETESRSTHKGNCPEQWPDQPVQEQPPNRPVRVPGFAATPRETASHY